MKNINECFYSLPAGLPEDVARLKDAGYYEAAIDLIDAYLAEDWQMTQNSRPYQSLAASEQTIAPNPMPAAPAAVRDAMTAARQMMVLLPRYYTYTEDDAFALLCEKIADFTEAEFTALFHANRLDWRFVNGVPMISRSFYASLIDTDAGYACRAGTPHDGKRNQMRDAIIAQMQTEGSAKMRFTLRSTMQASDEAFAAALATAKAAGKESVTVRAWLPYPAACDAQSEIQLNSAAPAAYTAIAPERAPARSVYWAFEATENPSFALEYAYTQTARYTKLPTVGGDCCKVKPLAIENGAESTAVSSVQGAAQGQENAADTPDFAPCLAEQPPHACFTPYLTALVAQLTQGVDEPLEKARAIYDYITLNVHYRYMPAYFVLENIAENCARSRRGDCGVMAICFITMCRIAGIPAHWESGLMVSPTGAGCHDWARFYIAPYGWLYADCSYGSSAAREEAETRRTHYFGNLDPHRMVANNTFFAPLTPPKQGWRYDPCDNQCGELEFEGVGILGKDLDTDVTVLGAE